MNKMVDLSDMAIAVFGTRFVHQQKIFEGLAKKPDPLMYRQQNRKIQNLVMAVKYTEEQLNSVDKSFLMEQVIPDW